MDRKPMGPRSRSKELPTVPTPPLVIRKAPKVNFVVPHINSPLSSSPRPSLSIQPIGSRSTAPKLGLTLDIPPANDVEYYQGLRAIPINTSISSPDERTIVPPSSTEIPRHIPSLKEPLDDIRSMLTALEGRNNSHSDDDDAIHAPNTPNLAWSDDVLEEISRLGEGAGGAVHKVRDKRTGRIMARKTITTREAPMKQLLRELLIISSTEHVNIIRFFGAYMSPSSSEIKILMELCEGGSLEAISRRIKDRNAVVGEKIAGRIAEGILQGLAYLHRQKTIHRDIKPSNILLTREGVVRLCDFGVSGELVESHAGTFTGTSFYMAPERICGEEYTIRADVWSTGISLLELVQNRFPFPNDLPPIELMMYITTGEPPRLDDEGGVQWSDDMKDFIKQTLTVDPIKRPIPKEMLKHPWIDGVMKQEAQMARWIKQVWHWDKPKRHRDHSARPGSSSRPSSSRTDSSGSSPSPSSPKKSEGI